MGIVFKNEGRSIGDLALFFLLMWPALVVAYGAVGKLLWLWFVVPLGVPEISVAQAVGLGVATAFFSNTVTITQRHKPEDFTALTAYGFYHGINLAIVLAVGGLIKLWLVWD